MVSGFPTAGGLPGYFRVGIKNNIENIIPASIMPFFLLLDPGSESLAEAKTKPNNAPIDVPSNVPETISPSFCHKRMLPIS